MYISKEQADFYIENRIESNEIDLYTTEYIKNYFGRILNLHKDNLLQILFNKILNKAKYGGKELRFCTGLSDFKSSIPYLNGKLYENYYSVKFTDEDIKKLEKLGYSVQLINEETDEYIISWY
jgi:hypothetical protein